MQRHIIFITLLLFAVTSSLAQKSGGVSIGKGKVAAHEKAILELQSNSKGILIPRLSSAERNAIFKSVDASAKGLMVFDMDENLFYYYTGSGWEVVGGNSTSYLPFLPKKVYYGTLTKYKDVSLLSVKNLTSKETSNGKLKISERVGKEGYFTLAIPFNWEAPKLSINGNETLNVFKSTNIINIEKSKYTIWQTDVRIPSGNVISIE